MAIKTVKVYATKRGARNTNVWCSSDTKSLRDIEAYPNRGYTEFENLITRYTKATVYVSYSISNSTSYNYSGSTFKVSTNTGTITSSTNVNYAYNGSSPTYSFSHSIFRDTSLKPFDGFVGWQGDDDVQSFACSVSSAYIEFQVEVPDATVQNLTTQGGFWERPIIVSWRSQNQVGYEYELYYNNNKISSGSGGTSTTFTIPANTFTGKLPASVRVRGYNTDDEGIKYYTSWSEQNIALQDITANISDLFISGNQWEFPINLSWQSTDQQQFRIEVLKDNVVVKTYTGTTAKGYTIPAGELSSGEHVFKVWVGYANRLINNQTKSITLKDIVATISNLIVNGEYWENDISLSWQSTDQQQFKIEVWKDNVLQDMYTGTTATRYVIPKNTLTAETYLLKVFVGYTNRFVNSQSKSITLKNIIPTVSNVAISGSNIDYSLILSWISTYQSKAELEIYKGSDKLRTEHLTTEKSYTIVNNTFASGTYTFKIRVAYISATGDRWSEFSQLNVTLVETEASIGALQPDGTIRDKDTDIEVWWTSQNQTKYTLKVGSYTYSGSTEKTHIVPAGTFSDTGDCPIILEVVYVTPNQVEKKKEKQAKFILAGKPSMPTITSGNEYAYNRPVITWDSVGQQGFICTIEDLDGNVVWNSDWQNGLINRVKCMDYLTNGVYNAKVQIMNNTLERSEVAVKEITINASENIGIALSVVDVEFGKKLTWTNENAYYQDFYILRNGLVIAKTDMLEYYDYACKHGENTYVIMGVTGNDTYNDSNIVATTLKLPHGVLSTVSLPGDCIDSELQRDNYNADMSHNINSTVVYLNGREAPIVIVGEHITEQYAIEFASNDYAKFISMCDRKETFIHRDRLGNVSYLSITNLSLKRDRLGGVYSTRGLKVDYREVVDYD